MKKVFTLAAMVIMMASAATVNAQDNNNNTPINYQLKMNIRSLSRYLDLSADQVEVISYAGDKFVADVARVEEEKDVKRPEAMREAVNRNLRLARNVLEDKQYHDYLNILNRTLCNKGLSVLLYSDAMAMNE